MKTNKGFNLSKVEGFSLVEMLVYMAILVLLLGIIFEVTISISRSDKVIKAARNIEHSAISAIERISREVRSADSASVATESLSLTRGTSTIEFLLSNSRLILRENGVDIGALTEGEARVTDLKFRFFSATSSTKIRTEITIESGTSTHYRVEKFYSSAVTR